MILYVLTLGLHLGDSESFLRPPAQLSIEMDYSRNIGGAG